ncbi:MULTISPECIES: glycosyltransferase [Brenneria]|uniref:Glycosyl transferase family 2 n=1 Tax=Brenneria nigrifluens DSM 30175 = ATCC 13028 TaxID=1121120 RepID=A0A2U1UXA7_9GAMM|nr:MULTISPECIES: glycosyltransferase [Brenneria]EHD22415.1 glycosyl transferase family 2 [Brenneria sp. EniD312]PWC26201.1 glycosyl transferase family 2 [Brenneria nigrifluens DSM 30175 = ATCC 13028]QCR05417.1 glycosyltransferase [Brenneria nigrifluens] [Brenneria nigrifluens DSM 30175 = ATCC 13028]
MSGKNKPKVSIYITTHNRLDKLRRAVDSVLKQDYPNIEVLVCDDASSDGTEEYISTLAEKDSRIVYLRNDNNQGACVARNMGIFKATGEFITGLDDDDEFTSNRIRFFVNNWSDELSFICCNFIERYIDGRNKLYYKGNKEYIEGNYEDLLFCNIASNQVFTTTEKLRKIGGFDIRARRLQDWDTWLRLSFEHGNFRRFKEATYVMHHDHKENEHRVSKSYPFSKALIDFKERNKDMYQGENLDFINFIISTVERRAGFLESLTWSFSKKAPKYAVKYALQFLPINRYD